MSKKKFFVVSDVHGYYSILKESLDKAGFDENNENHWLIVCGDAFDRGREPLQMLSFLMSLPRKILIRGNHEDLLESMCFRGYAMSHDKSNGTLQTVKDMVPKCTDLGNAMEAVLFLTKDYRESLLNYFETKNYIFVHGWIPCEKISGDSKPWWQMYKTHEYNPDWRNCNDVEWESARWTCGIRRGLESIIEPNKTIVCGHWHCSAGYVLTGEAEHEFDTGAIWEPFKSEGMIAIDRCTAHTGEINVLVIEDEFLE